MPTITATKLTKILVNRPAPRPDGKNLWIDIDINPTKSTALIHSQQEETVGTHKARKVTFRADYDCVIVFSNEAVFGMKSVPLSAYEQTVLEIRDTIAKTETFFEIFTGATLAEATETMPQEMIARNGPKIVVP
jgi:hypothetical protein